MRWFRALLALSLLLSLGRAEAADGRLPFDPVRLDAGLAKEGPPTIFAGMTHPPAHPTRYFLPTGFSFPARLVNAIYSYNVASPAVAVVDRDIPYLGKVCVPAGTRIIGTVSVQQDHDRVLVTFHTMVFPKTGDELQFAGIALSLDGSAGVKGKVETHKDSAVANTVLRSFVSGAAEAVSVSGVSPIAAQAAQGLSGEAGHELDQARQQVTTSISVDADTGVLVYIPQRVEY